MPRRLIAYALLLSYLPACATWRVSEGANVKQLLATQHPNALRVTTTSGFSKVLRFLSIVAGDTLVGFHRGEPSRIAVSDIKEVAIPGTSTSKTLALGVGIMSAFVVGGVIMTNLNNHGGEETVPQ